MTEEMSSVPSKKPNPKWAVAFLEKENRELRVMAETSTRKCQDYAWWKRVLIMELLLKRNPPGKVAKMMGLTRNSVLHSANVMFKRVWHEAHREVKK